MKKTEAELLPYISCLEPFYTIEEMPEKVQKESLLLANMPGVAFRCVNDANYTVTFLSDSCLGLTGYTAEELLSGQLIYNDLIHPEYRRALIDKWDSEEQDDTISTDEYPIITKSGKIKWVMEQSQRIYDEEKNVVGAEGFITDVTQRKLAEEALKQSEERFRTMFEEAPLGMAIFDFPSGKAYQVNTRYAEIIGRTKQELQSLSIKDYSFPEELEEVRHKINLLNEKVIKSFSAYQRLIRPNGEILWINVTIAPLFSAEEHTRPRLLCMIEDITDRKKAEEEILYLSYYDQLTGLFNRRFYVEELKRIDTERNLPITLIMADVNGLKLANDAFGHQTGDRLLKHIADTIKVQCRADDIIARIGGDEFVLLLPKTSTEEAERLVTRIKAALAQEGGSPVVCSVSFGWAAKEDPSQDISKIYINAEDHMYRRKLAETAAMRRDTIRLIIKTLFLKYKREKLLAKRVSRRCAEIGGAMGMNTGQIWELRTAGLMSNIGYIGLREELLHKEGKYTEAEWAEMERHPEISYQLLRSAGKFSAVAEYVLYHHERIDGKGYPSKVAADQIPLQSRIIAVASAFEAMTHERSYGEKLSPEEALEELERNAGTQFDREIVRIFTEMMSA